MLVLQPGSRGMRLGKLDFSLNEKGEVLAWQHQVIPLPKSVGDAPRMAAWYEAYNAEVKADYEKSVALKKQNMVSSPYAGETVCKTCHEREYTVWSQSRHAGAFYALQDVNKAFDPNCIVCHTVGFDKPGGFVDPQVTPELMHVQCESCHGAGKQHADSGGQQAVPRPGQEKEHICRQCHQPSHSPSFNFETYWPKIAHGKAVAATH
jgi:mono/diheme cytochrome c family protein